MSILSWVRLSWSRCRRRAFRRNPADGSWHIAGTPASGGRRPGGHQHRLLLDRPPHRRASPLNRLGHLGRGHDAGQIASPRRSHLRTSLFSGSIIIGHENRRTDAIGSPPAPTEIWSRRPRARPRWHVHGHHLRPGSGWFDDGPPMSATVGQAVDIQQSKTAGRGGAAGAGGAVLRRPAVQRATPFLPMGWFRGAIDVPTNAGFRADSGQGALIVPGHARRATPMLIGTIVGDLESVLATAAKDIAAGWRFTRRPGPGDRSGRVRGLAGLMNASSGNSAPRLRGPRCVRRG